MKITQLGRQAKVAHQRAMGAIFLMIFMSLNVQAFEFRNPARFCLISGSLNSSPETLVDVQGVLIERLGAKCSILAEPWLNPFQEVRRMRPVVGIDPVFTFWVDKDMKTSDLLIRGLDPKSFLQWGIVSAKIEGLSAGSQRAVLEDAVDRLIRQFPFVGFLDGEEFFVWAIEEIPHLQLFRIKDFERHPFLPQLIGFVQEAGSKPGWSIQREEGHWTLVPPAKPGLSKKNKERLWLSPHGR